MGRTPTIRGTDGDDVLRGTPGRDVIAGRRGEDTIHGLAGDDRICGGEGEDLLVGGRGNDRIDGGTRSDDLIGSAGNDLLIDPEGGDTAFGGGGDDVIRTGDGTDMLLGGPGDDVLDAGQGGPDEVVYVFAAAPLQLDLTAGTATGEGSDVVAGVEAVRGSDRDDAISGDAGPNTLDGGLGNDTVLGAAESDFLSGGGGDDAIDGGPGTDTGSFLSSPVAVRVDLAAGTSEGEGDDRMAGLEIIRGSHLGDTLSGDEGANRMFGGRGRDELYGLGGDDWLEADIGLNDGGPGTDSCLDTDENVDCERPIHPPVVAPSPGLITVPHEEQVLDNAAFHEISGTAWSHAFVGVRRLTPSGCRWWDAEAKRFVHRHCHRPVWDRAEGPKAGPWSYRLRRTLPEGWYRASLAVTSPGKNRAGKDPHRVYSVDFRLV